MFCAGLFFLWQAMASSAPDTSMPQGIIVLTDATGTAHPLRVEVASKQAELVRGLMFRKAIAPSDGMLFDLGMARPAQMWMKNTDIALDMIFFDENKAVVYVHHNAVPQSEVIIESPQMARYVLEVDAGKADGLVGSGQGARFDWQEQPE